MGVPARALFAVSFVTYINTVWRDRLGMGHVEGDVRKGGRGHDGPDDRADGRWSCDLRSAGLLEGEDGLNAI